MRKLYLVVLVFALLLGACGGASKQEQASPAASVLKVTDGKTEKSYSIDQLKALGTAQAAFKGVTYLGVPLSVLLKDAGFDPQKIAAVKATAVDGFSANYDPALINKADTLVAYARVDGPLASDEGPLRMVLPDQEGKLNPRQLVELTIIP